MEYNRLEAGERMREKRILLDWSQAEVAEKIERSPKYYADIERGSCSMSLETLLAISEVLDMSLDYIICGKIYGEEERKNTEEMQAVLSILNNASENKRKCGLRMLKVLLDLEDGE